jgi:hypothetical protein
MSLPSRSFRIDCLVRQSHTAIRSGTAGTRDAKSHVTDWGILGVFGTHAVSGC